MLSLIRKATCKKELKTKWDTGVVSAKNPPMTKLHQTRELFNYSNWRVFTWQLVVVKLKIVCTFSLSLSSFYRLHPPCLGIDASLLFLVLLAINDNLNDICLLIRPLRLCMVGSSYITTCESLAFCYVIKCFFIHHGRSYLSMSSSRVVPNKITPLLKSDSQIQNIKCLTKCFGVFLSYLWPSVYIAV